MIDLKLERAKADLALGKPVLIFDSWSREQEVDMVYYAGLADEEAIYRLRTEAGGLVCYATSSEVAVRLRLPLLNEVLAKCDEWKSLLEKGPSYGEKSAYSLWVNHINVRTGISDRDRSLTIRKLHEVVSLTLSGLVDEARRRFTSEFYFPGHVPILISRDLRTRKGHTELAVGLAALTGLEPSVIFAEMLDKGTSLSLNKAVEYAKALGIELFEGAEIIELWESYHGS